MSRDNQGIKVLIADDHKVMRDGLRLILETQDDIKVVGEASNGFESVSLSVKLQPDVVLMDIVMPMLNGIDATRLLRQRRPETQIVILTMHSSSEYIYRALQAGALGYILKESAGLEVIEAVRAASEKKRFLSRPVSDIITEEYMSGRLEDPRPKSPVERLSSRELQVLQLVVEGKSSKEIAVVLNVSPKTVDTYRSRIMGKLRIDNLPDLVKFAIRYGISG